MAPITHGFLFNALFFLGAAVIAVPISKRLGFGSILGYLVAGILLGPSGFKVITDVSDILHFSEFGVVLLLFLIGMELEPKRLWQMRMPVLGMGSLQVLGCILVFFVVGLLTGASFSVALLASMGFALSSTAMTLQVLKERNINNTGSGRAAFSILLFQDIAVIPMLALLPLLVVGREAAEASLWPVAKAILIIAGIVLVGRLVLHRVLHKIAALHLREIFTALALLLVVGMGVLMQNLQLSMGLGAFIAGVLLADSEYRHALETDIEPFKGLLLGLFFMSVGMSVNLASVAQQPLPIFGLVMAVLAVKFAIHYFLATAFKLPLSQIPFFALVLAQIGEFAFVLFGAAQTLGIINPAQAAVLVAASALSMLVSPLMIKVYDTWFAGRLEKRKEQNPDAIEDDNAPVIIAGFGRVGQIVGRLLFANGIKATVLDFEPDQIESLRRFGFKVYYGDATRLDLLETAGAGRAKVLVVAIDDVESNLALVDIAQKHFPNLQIVCRARNVAHVYELMKRGVKIWERETFDAALRMGRSVLETLNMSRHHAFSVAQRFRDLDHRLLEELFETRSDERQRLSRAKQAREDIERMFAEEEQWQRRKDEAWSIYDPPNRDQ